MKKVRELVVRKRFWKEAFLLPGCVFYLTTIVLTFLTEVPFVQKYKVVLFVALLIISMLSIFFFLIYKVRIRSVKLTINHSVVEVGFGDIFKQRVNDFKVIPFNEFFDTVVDGKIVSSHSLHGEYLLKKYADPVSRENLDERMMEDSGLRGNMVGFQKFRDGKGKCVQYKLGTVFKDDDYFLVAFSKVNDRNEAGLSLAEYVQCLLSFWEEVERYREGQTVVVPLFGTGITRYQNFTATHQDLLEILIWTFEKSKVHYKTPAKVKVVIHESHQKEIDFDRLKALEE